MLHKLDEDCAARLAEFLDDTSVLQLTQSTKQLKSLFSCNKIWQSRFERQFGKLFVHHEAKERYFFGAFCRVSKSMRKIERQNGRLIDDYLFASKTVTSLSKTKHIAGWLKWTLALVAFLCTLDSPLDVRIPLVVASYLSCHVIDECLERCMVVSSNRFFSLWATLEGGKNKHSFFLWLFCVVWISTQSKIFSLIVISMALVKAAFCRKRFEASVRVAVCITSAVLFCVLDIKHFFAILMCCLILVLTERSVVNLVEHQFVKTVDLVLEQDSLMGQIVLYVFGLSGLVHILVFGVQFLDVSSLWFQLVCTGCCTMRPWTWLRNFDVRQTLIMSAFVSRVASFLLQWCFLVMTFAKTFSGKKVYEGLLDVMILLFMSHESAYGFVQTQCHIRNLLRDWKRMSGMMIDPIVRMHFKSK